MSMQNKTTEKPKDTVSFLYNDGGRKEAGYTGHTGDCVARAIAIASGLPYQKVYDDLFDLARSHRDSGRGRVAKRMRERGTRAMTPAGGAHKILYDEYIKSLGFKWVPCMKPGTGCRVHLKREELPSGRIIARLSRHLSAVIDGIINDTYDPSREGTRCVYGYYIMEKQNEE